MLERMAGTPVSFGRHSNSRVFGLLVLLNVPLWERRRENTFYGHLQEHSPHGVIFQIVLAWKEDDWIKRGTRHVRES